MFLFNFLDNILFYTQYPLSLECTFIVRNSLTMKNTVRNRLTFLSFWLFPCVNIHVECGWFTYLSQIISSCWWMLF